MKDMVYVVLCAACGGMIDYQRFDDTWLKWCRAVGRRVSCADYSELGRFTNCGCDPEEQMMAETASIERRIAEGRES